jgi:glutaredoxin-dependent peroxiredoxin
MLAAGDRAATDATVWTAPNVRHTLGELLADGRALFVFYLFDWSATWTHELELLRDRSAEFEEAGVSPFGISADSEWTHIAWSQALDLNFPLLSDWNGEAMRAFGVEGEFRGHHRVAERTAFLVDQDGTVRGAWRYDTAEVPDFDELLRAAQAL